FLSWSFGDSTTAGTQSLTHYYSAPGTYVATLYITGNGHCMDSAKQTIHLYLANPILTYSPLAGCSRTTTTLHISSLGNFNYTWDMGDGVTIPNADSDLVYSYLIPGRFVPKVILKEESSGCKIP